jgi:plastocyanin
MKKIRGSKFVDFKISPFALVTIVAVMMLRVASASPAPQPGSAASAQPTSSALTPDQATEVKIDNFVFSPAVVTVKLGTEVTWINKDDIPHTVDSTDGKFKSAALDTEEKFRFRPTAPGEYPFYCRMHPKMTGKIIVQP